MTRTVFPQRAEQLRHQRVRNSAHASVRTNVRRLSLMVAIVVGAAQMLAFGHRVQAQTSLPGNLKEIVYRNAPFIMAETYDRFYVQRFDHIMPVDFDGDELGANNTNITPNTIVDGRPTVYYSVTETGYTSDQGYYFLGYYIYHVNDGGQDFSGFLAPGHEHDMEGVYLVVKKSPYYPLGAVAISLAEAHGALIPSFNNAQSAVDLAHSPAGGPWVGRIQFWTDGRYNTGRPVVAIRGRTHGTYMAEDCSGATQPNWSDGYGMWLNSVEIDNTYTGCIHSGHHMIVYVPVQSAADIPSSGLPYAEPLDSATRDGTHLYRLVHVVDSPLWRRRADPQVLFDGNLLTMDGGPTGREFFRSSTGSLDANPPWAWYGGRGECHYVAGTGPYCWYSFAVDNTSASYAPYAWPRSVAGRLLTNPVAEMQLRFPWLPELNAPVRYNAYVPPATGYYTPPLSASIDGPTTLNSGDSGTWTAVVSGGVAPFQYQWSGLGSGTASSTSATVTTGDYVYLDVWDAAGQHFATSLYVNTIGGCPNDPTAVICE